MPRVKHVVLLRLNKNTSASAVGHMFKALADLKQKIPGLLDFSAGSYSSPEGLGKGYTHGFVITFADEASRNGYLTHPDHELVKKLIVPELDGGLDGVVAFDWVE